MHLCSAEIRVLSYLLRHLHGLLGTNNIMLAVLDPLFGGGRATTVGSFACVRRGNTEVFFFFVDAENKGSGHYPEGTRFGLVFSEIWADAIVSDRQDKSISRASILFWMSAVRRWRASCKTLGEQTVQRSQERCQRVQDLRAATARRTTLPLTTGARRPCPRVAAELAALPLWAPPPSSAAPPPGPRLARVHAVHLSASGIPYWPPGERRWQPTPARSAPWTDDTSLV